ncbi:MAG: hypothetical protein ACYTEQ_05860 [Planctomycetota bacterium]|jgi:hypothetical protein
MQPVEKTKAGWNIPVPVKDKFTEFCSSVGSIVQDDCAGALLVWTILPAQVRELAKKQAKICDTDTKIIWCWLVDALLDKVVSDNLEAAGISRDQAIAILKKRAEQESRD